jgi:hypothetical protein
MKLPERLPTTIERQQEQEPALEIPTSAFPERLPERVVDREAFRQSFIDRASIGAKYAEDPENERAKIENAMNLAEFLEVNERMAYRHQQQLIDEWNRAQVSPGEPPKNFLDYWKKAWFGQQLQDQIGKIGFQMFGLNPESDEWKALYSKTKELSSQIPPLYRERFPLPVRWVGDAIKFIEQRRGGLKKGIPLGLAMGTAAATATAIGGTLALPVLPEEAITVPSSFATFFGYGVTAGMMENIGEIETGSHYLEQIERGIDPVSAKWAAFGVGVGNMMIEMFQFQNLFQTIPGAKKLLREGIEHASKNTIMRVWGAANRWAWKKYGRTLTQLPAKVAMTIVMQGIFAGKETLQEVAQEVTQVFSLELMDWLQNVEGRDRKLSRRVLDAFPRLWETAKHSFGGFFLLGAPGNIMQTSLEDYSVLQKERDIKNPIDTKTSQEEKADALLKYSEQNKIIVDPILKEIDTKLGTESKSDIKTKERIIEKANRRSIAKDRPWHNVEHIRDSFRFETVVENLDQVKEAVKTVTGDTHVSEVVKIDTEKMLKPTRFGRRSIHLDLRMDNGQIVEYQLILKEIESAEKSFGHKIYERWRDATIIEKANHWETYRKDIKRSQEGYSKALNGALTRLGYDLTTFRASLRSLSRFLREVTSEKLSLKSLASKTALYQTPEMRTIGIGRTEESAITQTRPEALSKAITAEEVSKEKPPTERVPEAEEKVKREENWQTRYREKLGKEAVILGYITEEENKRRAEREAERRAEEPAAAEAPGERLTADDIQANAKKYYGITNDPREAGYIMNDGTMLDFSGRHYSPGYEKGKPIPGQPDHLKGMKNVDHREVNIKALFNDERSYDPNERMLKFEIEGNGIRVSGGENDVSVMLQDGQNPTEEQWNRIDWMRRRSADKTIYYDIYGDDFYLRARGETENINELKDDFYQGIPFEEFDEAEVREEASRIQAQRMEKWRGFQKYDLVARINDIGKIKAGYCKGAEGLKGINPWVRMNVFTTEDFAMDLDEVAAMMGISDDQLIQELKRYERMKKPSERVTDYFEEAKQSLREQRAKEEEEVERRPVEAVSKQTVNEMELEEGMTFTIDGEQYTVVSKTTAGVMIQDSRKVILGDFENIEIDEGSLMEAEVLAEYPELVEKAKPAPQTTETHDLVRAYPDAPFQKIVIQNLTGRGERFHWTLFEKDEAKEYYEARREYDYETREEAQENLSTIMKHRKERGAAGQLPPPGGKGPPRGGRRRMHKYFDDAERQISDELWDAYQALSNLRFADRDEQIFLHIPNEKKRFQKAIKTALGHSRYTKEVQDYDIAMHIYIDLKRNPEHLKEFYDELTDEQKKWVDLSQNLPEELVAICDQVEESYQEIGRLAKDSELVRNIIDNYVSRVWDFKGKEIPTQLRRFGTKTRHALPRTFETIVEGWSYGYNLKIKGLTNNLASFKEEIWKTIVDKRFMSALRKIKDPDGNPLITTYARYPGYKQIKNPDFKIWEYSATSDVDVITELMQDIYEHVEEIREGKDEQGQASGTIEKLRMIVEGALQARGMTEGESKNAIDRLIASKNFEQADKMTKIIERQVIESEMPTDIRFKPVGGKNFFQTDTGAILERKELYAHPLIANDLNKILGTSALRGIPLIDEITKYNAIIKSFILQTSLFHHQAFLRSYYLPGLSPKRWEEMNFIQAYKAGVKSIENAEEEIVLGVRNGLTFNLRQDWDEEMIHSQTVVGKILDKCKATKKMKDTILDLRRKQADFLFGEFGAGLKAKAFLIEFRHQLKNNPSEDPNIIASRVAKMVNDDFGGLHLDRLSRNPTLQHIFRLFMLAPDWTESNVRTMLKAFHVASKDGKELAMYQRFWAGVIIKGLGATALANFALAGGDVDEFLDRYREAWGENWREALRMNWMAIDITPIYRAFGGDRNKRKYFSLIGHFRDPFKFVARPITSLHHKGSVIYGIFHEALAGTDWKGDKFTTLGELLETGKTVTYGKGGPIQYDQFPSYLISQLVGIMPTQIQNLIAWASGEMEAFDAILRSLGMHISTKYTEKRGA